MVMGNEWLPCFVKVTVPLFIHYFDMFNRTRPSTVPRNFHSVFGLAVAGGCAIAEDCQRKSIRKKPLGGYGIGLKTNGSSA